MCQSRRASPAVHRASDFGRRRGRGPLGNARETEGWPAKNVEKHEGYGLHTAIKCRLTVSSGQECEGRLRGVNDYPTFVTVLQSRNF